MNPLIISRNIQDLQTHFHKLKALSERALKCWSKYFIEHLTEDELDRAVDLAMISYGCDHDLCAKDLVELVKGSERELALECWARTLDALSRKFPLSELDDASQYAIAQLGGLGQLGALPITELQRQKFDFITNWQAFRKDPDKEFKRPSEHIPPVFREYQPSDIEAEISEEQKAINAKLLSELKNKLSLGKKNPEVYQQIAKASQQQFKQELGNLTVNGGLKHE